MNVKGLSIEEIMNIDLNSFNKLNESELRAITSRLVSAGNKRIRRLQGHDINSPAIQSLGDDKTFSTKLPANISKQQRVNKLRQEFARARSFLTSETSTIRGYKKFKKRTLRRIAKEIGISTRELEKKVNVNKLFNLLHKAQSDGIASSYRGSKGSLQARNTIAEILIEDPDISDEDLTKKLENALEELYEEDELDETEEFDL
ncbi:MAG: hypothetical protein J6T10_27150 [Methanobrevibacter sp.]|nr:hypothetical protein [Methanobrevibacter sp.]